MKTCTRCGNSSEDNASFCSRCGNSHTAQTYVTGPVPKDRTPFVVAAAMVAILIVAAVAGAVALSSAMSNLPWSNWTDSEAQMTVQTCTPGNATAPEGKQYVTVTAWVQNLGHDSLTLTPGRFLLLTGEGGYYSGTYDVPSQMPGTLSKGEGAAATVGFLIPADETPASLRLIIIEDLLSHVDASIPA